MTTRLAQYGFSGGVISPEIFGRADLEKYSLSLKKAKNCTISKAGAVRNRPGTEFVGEVKDSSQKTRIVPFQFSTTQSYVLEWNESLMRPIMDAGQILRSATNITACTSASPGVFASTSHGASVGDRVYITGVTGLASGGISQINDRVMIVASVPTANSFTLTDLYGNAFNTGALTAYSSGGTVARLYELAFPYADTEIFDVGYAQTADTMLLAHLAYAPRKLTRTGHASWTVSTIAFGAAQAAPTNPAATNTVGTGATTYSYKITAIDEDTGEESLPTAAASATNDLTVAGNYNTISWTAASGAERYIVYKADNGVYGLIGGTTGASFIDDNILPDMGDTPPTTRNPFSSSGNYPSRVSFHEGRSIWARTTNTPGGVWASVSNLYYNMNVASPAKADDAVTLDLRPGVNAVTGIASMKKLVVLTTEAEYTIEGGGVTKYITPSSIVVERHTARGSAALQPIVIGDLTLRVERQGGAIMAFGYSFEKDGYKNNDLTLLAPHLFRGRTVIDWCYQQNPESVVWCVMSDGAVLSLTFVEDQNTFAWCDHHFGGSFGSTAYGIAESCCVIEGDEQDDVYFVVKRTINSATKRYIERLMPRWRATFDASDEITNVADMYFLDCGVVGASVSGSTVYNLHHLEGQSVYALADGDVQGPFTVSNGQITISPAATTVHVGLRYVADVIDLPVIAPTRNGAVQGRYKALSTMVLKLNQTRGIKYGDPTSADAKLLEIKQRDTQEEWGDPIAPYTGDTNPLGVDGKMSLDGSVLIRQDYPLPMEILMIAKDVVFGGP